MVINFEQKQGKILASYINKEGDLASTFINVPATHQYSYVYAKNRNEAEKNVLSWDDRAVKKVPAQFLDKHRLQEFLEDAGENITGELFKQNTPKLYSCDIEVDVTDDGFPEPDEAKNRINSISWVRYPEAIAFGIKKLSGEEIDRIERDVNKHVEKFGRKYKFIYKQYDNEADMLYDFLYNYARKAPLITGWFFWSFDWDYIYNRCTKKLNMDISWLSPTKQWYKHKIKLKGRDKIIMLPKHKLIVDYMAIYKKWDRTVDVKENDTLDFVTETVLGVKKVKYPGTLQDLFNKDFEKYIFYNVIDSVLVELLDEHLKTMSTFLGLGNVTKVEAMDAFSPIKMLSATLSRYAYKKNKVFPKTWGSNKRQDYPGAFVFEPSPGLYEWVASFDFASLYPSIMRQFKISIENFVGKNKNAEPSENQSKCVSGAIFDTSEEPLLPEILTSYYNKRKKAKKISQAAESDYSTLEHILKERSKTL